MSEMMSSENLMDESKDSIPSNPTVNEEDYDSESTIIHLDNKDDKSLDVASDSIISDETNASKSPTFSADFRSFSPLPSTSSDNITIHLNNTRFNGYQHQASGHYRPSLNLPSVLVTKGDDEIIIPADKNSHQPTTKSSNDLNNIIECSSGSETDDNLKAVNIVNVKNENNSKSRKRSKLSSEVIDLLLDDFDEKIYDSDCEIVDVDLLLAENNAVLNRHSQSQVIELSETNDAEILADAFSTQDTSENAPVIIAPEEKNINTFEKMKMIVKDFFDKHSRFLKEQKTDDNICKSSPGSVINVMSSMIKIPHSIENRKKRKRDKPTKVKRRKVVETIDLSDNSYSNPRVMHLRAPEIIVIDSDSSMIIENSSSVDSNLEAKSSPVINFQNINIPDRSMQTSIETPAKSYGDCPVCLESFSQGNAVSTFCGHIFCATCMNKIKLTSKKCPKCRKSLGRGKGFHPIFL